jgi:hypothetical protein
MVLYMKERYKAANPVSRSHGPLFFTIYEAKKPIYFSDHKGANLCSHGLFQFKINEAFIICEAKVPIYFHGTMVLCSLKYIKKKCKHIFMVLSSLQFVKQKCRSFFYDPMVLFPLRYIHFHYFNGPLKFEISEEKVNISFYGLMVLSRLRYMKQKCNFLCSAPWSICIVACCYLFRYGLMVKCLRKIDISCFDKPCFMTAPFVTFCLNCPFRDFLSWACSPLS